MKYKEKLKIVHVSSYYLPSSGGVVSVIKYIAEELVKRGHEVHVFAPNRDHRGNLPLNSSLKEKIDGVIVRRFHSIFNLGHISLCPKEFPELWKSHFDIIHSHCYRHPHVDISTLIGNFKSVPTILHGHGPFFQKQSLSLKKSILYSLYDRQAKRVLLKRVDGIIALTRDEKQQYVMLGADPQKITVIPNAASDDCFGQTNPTAFIKKYKLSGKKIILYLSFLHYLKRPDLLIKALPALVKEVPDLILLLVGPDAGMIDHIKKIGAELGVESNFKWLGPLYGKEKHQAYQAADFFVLPSDEEPFGIVILEAMAHKKPVIVSDAVGPSEIIEHGETGFIVKRGNVDQIIEFSLKLLTDQSLRARMGEKGCETAINKYSVSSVVDQVEAMYYRLIESKS